jgi:hypothetical protein
MLFKQRKALIQRMKDVFGAESKRINHALAVLKYAGQIHVAEGGDHIVVTAAAILHDIGIHQAERKCGSTAGKYLSDMFSNVTAIRLINRFHTDKLADILRANKLKGLTVVHMEVPCCHGLTRIANEAMARAGQKMMFEDVTVGLQGGVEKVEMIQPE